MAIKPFVFLRTRASQSDSLLAHELVHIQQQQRYGLFTYLWRYWTRVDFRRAVEFEAYYMGSGMGTVEARVMAEGYTNLLWYK